MQNLFAPWRETYITKVIKNQHKGCTFCRIINEKKDQKNYVFIRGSLAFAVLNIYPYSNGHCLVLPYRHVNDIDKLTKEEMAQMMAILIETKALLKGVLNAHGFNVGLNLGQTAGAGIPGHVHMHIVPRWRGDHNFMPITAGTKVISKSLTKIYKELRDAHTQRH